jgi:ribonuclease HII
VLGDCLASFLHPFFPGLDWDAARRAELAEEIRSVALALAVVRVGPDTIDRTGLHRANLALNARALKLLPGGYDYALADGFPIRMLAAPVLAVRKGDQIAACVAAASIIAKTTRDKIMVGAARRYRGYGFERHKGYGTDQHWAALRVLGPSAYHRLSFAGVAAPWAAERPVGATGAGCPADAVDPAPQEGQ